MTLPPRGPGADQRSQGISPRVRGERQLRLPAQLAGMPRLGHCRVPGLLSSVIGFWYGHQPLVETVLTVLVLLYLGFNVSEEGGYAGRPAPTLVAFLKPLKQSIRSGPCLSRKWARQRRKKAHEINRSTAASRGQADQVKDNISLERPNRSTSASSTKPSCCASVRLIQPTIPLGSRRPFIYLGVSLPVVGPGCRAPSPPQHVATRAGGLGPPGFHP